MTDLVEGMLVVRPVSPFSVKSKQIQKIQIDWDLGNCRRQELPLLSLKASAFRDWRKSLAKNFVNNENVGKSFNDQTVSQSFQPVQPSSERTDLQSRSASKYGLKFDSMVRSIGNITEVR